MAHSQAGKGIPQKRKKLDLRIDGRTEQRRWYNVHPGLTVLAQINGRNSATVISSALRAFPLGER